MLALILLRALGLEDAHVPSRRAQAVSWDEPLAQATGQKTGVLRTLTATVKVRAVLGPELRLTQKAQCGLVKEDTLNYKGIPNDLRHIS